MQKPRLLAVAFAAALVFSACQAQATPTPTAQPTPTPPPGETPGPTPTAAPTPTPSGGPVSGGTMIFGSAADPATLDAVLIQDGESFRIAQQIYDTLVRLKPGSADELEPGLAASWDVQDGGKTIVFAIQPGAKFHDGTPADAEAVAYNFNRWKNLPEALQGLDYYDITVFGGYGDNSNIASAEATGTLEVTVKLNAPKADILTAMTLIPFAIQSPTALEAHKADLGESPDNDYWQTAPTGTGPFKFEGDWVVGDHYTIVRNDDYWDTAHPAYLDSVVFKPIAESAQRVAALRAGTVDIIDFVDANQLDQITSDPALQRLDRPPLTTGWIGFNQRHKPFDDLKVRQAVAYAIDKQAIVEAFFPGLGQVADSDVFPSFPTYEAGVYPGSYDRAKAKELLDSSSCPSPCAIDFWYPDEVSRPYMVDPKGEFEAMRPMLEAAGFVVTPQHKAWRGGYLTDDSNGRLPMFLIGWIYDYADPADGPGIFYAKSQGECDGVVPEQPMNCEYGEENPDAYALMQQAISEFDTAKRNDLWKQAMRMYGADLPKVPLVWSASVLGAVKTLHGYVPSPTQSEYFNLVWKEASS